MRFTVGPSNSSWQPIVTVDTTDPDYWLNWRFLLCSIWIMVSVIIAVILIWRYEGPRSRREGRTDHTQQERIGTLYDDKSWRPCLKIIHPAWLLAFRVVSFFLLLALLILNVVVDGGSIFFYYTQWTFMLVIVYFGLGSLLSLYGCHQYCNKMSGQRDNRIRSGSEHGTYVAHKNDNANGHARIKSSHFHEEHNIQEVAGFWGYVFQILFQINGGAVMLTDFVFWLIMVPFLAMKDYDLNLILVCMHSVNAIFLLGDTALNSLRFPWFRISYFLLWTSGFVIFQWIFHACISIWWPYPFLELSSPKAPIWYLLVALMHIPCYAIFPLIMKMKHSLLSKHFPQSYHSPD